MKKAEIIIFLVYCAFALYFINYSLEIVKIPQVIVDLNIWIFLIGGGLLFLGAINYFRARKKTY